MKMPSALRCRAQRHANIARTVQKEGRCIKVRGSWTAGGSSRTEGNAYTVKCEGLVKVKDRVSAGCAADSESESQKSSAIDSSTWRV